jgi:hypothetical protein
MQDERDGTGAADENFVLVGYSKPSPSMGGKVIWGKLGHPRASIIRSKICNLSAAVGIPSTQIKHATWVPLGLGVIEPRRALACVALG